ncbi:peptidase U32 family protein [Spirochaeta cellobiosiphila]|uniref:peptidase U32 family protein n=1 Tax=Spirochaeta cellobiosiphila TaxID=504483 RepID=UPI00048FA010|nr:peptidase U32 family protein [Spirochaeta cellobiosiphila]
MSRKWNDRDLELLAPAGTFEIFKSVITSKCDAVYLGGQHLNMRMIRKGYNLTNQELKDAINIANDHNKKIYITLNSLIDPEEVNEALDYLDYLDTIKPHGLIIQDLGLLQLIQERQITIPLHSSVMMNVHNLTMVDFLSRRGISKVVLSREMTLDEVRYIHCNSDVELEYFTHGDMCVAHGAQCLYSSFVFGMSSNRGRCLKPCRWPYQIKGVTEAPPYPLAVKDMNMYQHLGDMILAGVTSFKIEGRMREKDFIVSLVNKYGDALDQFLEDPLYRRVDNLDEFKKRDFSTGYAYGKPGISNINTLGEGSGKFYSTGKMFSTPTAEKEIDLNVDNFAAYSIFNIKRQDYHLNVKVNSIDQAVVASKAGADRVILTLEPLAPAQLPSINDIENLANRIGDKTDLYLALPRMTKDKDDLLFKNYFAKNISVKGIYINHVGCLEYLDNQQYDLAGDTGLNTYNHLSLKYLKSCGVSLANLSIEMPFSSFHTLAKINIYNPDYATPEIMIHGRPTMMYMEHDISSTEADDIELVTEAESLHVKKDIWNRYHMLSAKDYTLLPRISELLQSGYREFRLELQDYDISETSQLLYQIQDLIQNQKNMKQILMSISQKRGLTYGAQR